MTDNTKIEWADATVNAINGCTVISPGCTNCYAMRSGGRNLPNHPSTGLTAPSKAGHVWTGEVRLNEKQLMQPLRWKKPRRIFWNAHGDMFHENVPDEWIDRCFAVMALTPQHIHMILTKRSVRMRKYLSNHRWHIWAAMARELLKTAPNWTRPTTVRGGDCTPIANVWLGVSVEDQNRADERIPDLLATPAAVRFLSCEPLLGPVDLTAIQAERFCEEDSLIDWKFDCLQTGDYYFFEENGCFEGGDGPDRETKIDWVIAGGESGTGARPMHPDWVRSLRDQCAAAGVAFHFKQWGEWVPTGSVDAYCHGPAKNKRQFPNSCGISWLSDGRICCEDFSVAEHKKRMASGAAYNTRAVEVNLSALEDFWKSSEATSDTLGYQWMYKVGKKRAGRTLDGVTHDGLPA